MAADGGTRQGDNIGHRLVYEDLRDWIEEADKLGEIKRVTGASWEKEIGMAATVVSRDENGPAVLFDGVPGCAENFRVLVNTFGGKRKNMCLGFPLDLDKVGLSEAFADLMRDPSPGIPPRVVADGPVMENVQMGDEVDLEIFPTPIWHEKDGGRYIGTGCYIVTRDPETGWTNLGCYRVMLKGKRKVGHNVLPSHHGDFHLQKYQAMGERMPVAIVLGGDLMALYMGASALAEEESEFDMLGKLRGHPIDVVEGRVTGLPFPADAEIVLEGYVDTDTIEPEGPFGDWTGTYTEKGRVNPVVHIDAVYYRNDPILLGFVPQNLPDEFSRYCAITRSATVRRDILAAGVPDVRHVWCHEVGGARMLIGVSITQRYAGHAQQAGHLASMSRSANGGNRWVIVTDDDIDVWNLEELIWAALMRSDPETSINLIRGASGAPSDPRLTPWDRKLRNFSNSRFIIDACRPWHWRDEMPEPTKPSPEHLAAAMKQFGHLLDGE